MFKIIFDSGPDLVLSNFYGMTPPPKDEIKKREKAVARIIESMGYRYALFSNIERKDHDGAR